jgi:hypothetical protein
MVRAEGKISFEPSFNGSCTSTENRRNAPGLLEIVSNLLLMDHALQHRYLKAPQALLFLS